LARMMGIAVKLMSLALALPLALLCVFSSDILGLWLGDSFRSLGGLMTLQLCTLVVNLGVLPLFSINMATNQVKLPAILTLVMGGLNFVLAIWFVKQFELGYYGVVIAGLIVLTLKNALFTPWYAAHLLNLRHFTFFRPLLNGFLAFCLLYAVAFGIRSQIHSESPAVIGLTMILLILVSVLPLAWWGFSKEERSLVAEMAPQRLRSGCKKLLLASTQ
jgi:O-antigen/teichoic acid export membrane protein